MELPPALRQAVDAMLQNVALTDLKNASSTLSGRYRAEIRDGQLHLKDRLAALAYLAARLPATYAAVHSAFAAVAQLRPDFTPETMLDVGAGPGTALWAAADLWPELASVSLLEASASIRKIGEELSTHAAIAEIKWLAADVTQAGRDNYPRQPTDLVTLAYVLDELSEQERQRLVERLWNLTQDMLIIVEPGTPAGYRRIMAARDMLVAQGAHIIAPCPHALSCPLVEPDWCHFSRRVARTRVHRLTKNADVPWEDEKYSFIALSRHKLPESMADNIQSNSVAGRILSPPKAGAGKVSLKLCTGSGVAGEYLITKRQGDLFKKARRADWGDIL